VAYLKELIAVLSEMPAKLVRSGFEALAKDKSFSHRMRARFEQALDFLDYQERRGQPPPLLVVPGRVPAGPPRC